MGKRAHSPEFKREAVRQLLESGVSIRGSLVRVQLREPLSYFVERLDTPAASFCFRPPSASAFPATSTASPMNAGKLQR